MSNKKAEVVIKAENNDAIMTFTIEILSTNIKDVLKYAIPKQKI